MAADFKSDLAADEERRAQWIDFSHTENPFGTPESFTKALIEATKNGIFSYEPDRSSLALRHALSRTLKLPEESFLVGSSVSNMIGAVSQAFEPGTVGVHIPCPVEYVLALNNTGHRIERIPSTTSYITPAASALSQAGITINAAVLSNPGYPTSRLLPEQVLLSYLEMCDWVVVDERSIELTLGGKSYAPLVAEYRNLVVVQTFSEQYALPGIPVSYCIAHPDILSEISRFYDASPVSAAAEVLADPSVREHQALKGVRDFLYGEIPWMQTMLSLIPGIEIVPAEANYVMCAYRGSGSKESVGKLDDLVEALKREGLLIRKLGETPGLGSGEHFCVSVRARQENERLVTSIRRLA